MLKIIEMIDLKVDVLLDYDIKLITIIDLLCSEAKLMLWIREDIWKSYGYPSSCYCIPVVTQERRFRCTKRKIVTCGSAAECALEFICGEALLYRSSLLLIEQANFCMHASLHPTVT